MKEIKEAEKATIYKTVGYRCEECGKESKRASDIITCEKQHKIDTCNKDGHDYYYELSGPEYGYTFELDRCCDRCKSVETKTFEYAEIQDYLAVLYNALSE